MALLTHAVVARGETGEPIPNPYWGLRQMGAHIRRSQLSMVAAASGTGKTAFVMDWMLHLNHLRPGDPLHVLYFSMDSDIATVATRALAGTTGLYLPQAEEQIKRGTAQAMETLRKSTRHMWFSWNPSPDVTEMAAEIARFGDVHGKYPDVIVADNLSDIDHGDMESMDVAKWLQVQAGTTGAAVVLLHHVTGPYATGTDVVPMQGVHNQIHRPQRLILTLSVPEPGICRVSVVKNSNGPAQKDGGMYEDIPCDLSRMRFEHG